MRIEICGKYLTQILSNDQKFLAAVRTQRWVPERLSSLPCHGLPGGLEHQARGLDGGDAPGLGPPRRERP